MATGAGLHAAAYYIEHHSKLGSVGHGAVGGGAGRRRTSCPIYLLYALLVRTVDAFHLLLLVLTAAVLGGRGAGWPPPAISMANCLLVVTLAPMVTRRRLRTARASALPRRRIARIVAERGEGTLS